MPARIYPVTLGNLSNFVRRVNRKPESNIIAIAKMTADTGETACNCAYNLSTFHLSANVLHIVVALYHRLRVLSICFTKKVVKIK